MLIGGLEFVEISRYGLLVALDTSSRDVTDEGVDVQDLGASLTRYGNITTGKIGILLATTLAIFSSHKTEKIGLSSVKLGCSKFQTLLRSRFSRHLVEGEVPYGIRTCSPDGRKKRNCDA
jgi:hypothetical protein